MHCEKWEIIDTGKASAVRNMAIDVELLDQLASEQKRPILHLYDWDVPSATYGHFTDPYRFIHPNADKLGLQLARRPTGGGMIFHLTDLAFSILVPASHYGYSVNVLDNYAFVNYLVIEAVKRFTNLQIHPHLLSHEPQTTVAISKHFCMAKPTKYDVMLEGRKIGGGAQRRTKHGFLHQGSISLSLPPIDFLNKILLPQQGLIEAMQATTYALIPFQPTLNLKQLGDARRELSQLLIDVVLARPHCFKSYILDRR
ncbi:MAG: hypothetical protein H0X29_11675 [Parachlamydiaceae bacterium]|nr:hypothetical protein [Parachlamydiaceae bacterium]